jgi:hypothetical protein
MWTDEFDESMWDDIRAEKEYLASDAAIAAAENNPATALAVDIARDAARVQEYESFEDVALDYPSVREGE